jgi:hypothetical protein
MTLINVGGREQIGYAINVGNNTQKVIALRNMKDGVSATFIFLSFLLLNHISYARVLIGQRKL